MQGWAGPEHQEVRAAPQDRGPQGSAHRATECHIQKLGFTPGGRQAWQTCPTRIPLAQAESRGHNSRHPGWGGGRGTVAQAEMLETGREAARQGDTGVRDSEDLGAMGGRGNRRGLPWVGQDPREGSCPILPREAPSSKGQLRASIWFWGTRMVLSHKTVCPKTASPNTHQTQNTPYSTKLNLRKIFTVEMIDLKKSS